MFYFKEINGASEYGKDKIHNIRLLNAERDSGYDVMQPGYLAKVTGVTNDDLLSDMFTRVTGAAYDYPNYNGFNAEAPTAPLTDRVVVCDPAVVAEATGNNGLKYRVGNETYGNSLEEGRLGRAREFRLFGLYKFGDENFAAPVGANKYAVLTAGSYLLTPAAAIPATGFCVEITKENVETTGAEAGFTTYTCFVVQL